MIWSLPNCLPKANTNTFWGKKTSFRASRSFYMQCPEFNKKLPGISEDRNKRKISDAYIELGDNDFKRTGWLYSRKKVTRWSILSCSIITWLSMFQWRQFLLLLLEHYFTTPDAENVPESVNFPSQESFLYYLITLPGTIISFQW